MNLTRGVAEMKNYIESTIYISGKYLVAVMAITTSLVFSQNLSGDWSGDVSSFQNAECAGDPFVVNDIQLSLESDGLLQGEIFADYTFEDICGMIGGEVEDDGLCHSASSTSSASELMPTYCQLFEGEYDGQTCHTEDTIQGSWTLEEDAAGDPEFCVTTIDSETNEPVTECGPAYIGVDDNGEIYELDFTITNFADSEGDSDSCVLFSLERDDDGGGPCEFLNCDNLHLVSALPPLVLDSLSNFGYFSWEDVANGIENDLLRYGIYELNATPSQNYEFYPASNIPMFNDVENGQFVFAYEYPNGYPQDSVSYMWGVQAYELQVWNNVISEEGLNFAGYVSEPQECLSIIYGNGLSDENQTYYGRTWDPNDYSEELDSLANGEPIGDSIWSFDSYGSCEPLFQDEPEDDLTEVGFYLDGSPCAGNPGVLGSWDGFNSPIEMMYDEYDMDFYIYVDLPAGSHEFTFVCVGPNGEVEFTEDLEPNSDCTDGGGNRMINVPMIDNPDDWHDLPDYSWGLCPGEEYVCDILDCNNLQLVSRFPQQAIEYYTSMGWSFEDIGMAIESGEIEYGVSNSYDQGWTSANYLPQMSNSEEGDFVFAWQYPEGYPGAFDTLFYF